MKAGGCAWGGAAARRSEISGDYSVNPGHVGALIGLGEVSAGCGQLEAAIDAAKQAMHSRDIGECWTVLGSDVAGISDLDGAAAAYRRARVWIRKSGVYNNLANALKDRGELAEAAGRRIGGAGLRPTLSMRGLNLGIVLLLAGDLGRGFCVTKRGGSCGSRHTRSQDGGVKNWGACEFLHTYATGVGGSDSVRRYAPMVAGRGVSGGCVQAGRLKAIDPKPGGISRGFRIRRMRAG